ncbi:MAG: GAF domain-containing protein [Anaerolineae bacterium]|nr:GAF domain-containing protein [Anaerolineae bacterium]
MENSTLADKKVVVVTEPVSSASAPTETAEIPVVPPEMAREKIIESIVLQAIRFFTAERGCLITLQDSGELHYELGRTQLSEVITEEQFRASNTVIKVTLSTRKPQMLPDLSAYDNLKNADSIIMGKKRVIICGPLVKDEKLVGVLYMDGQLPKPRFNDNQMMMFMRLCDRAADAIARL